MLMYDLAEVLHSQQQHVLFPTRESFYIGKGRIAFLVWGVAW